MSDYPDGQLGPDDEGAIATKIGVDTGTVIVDFGKPVTWLGLDPHSAVEMALKLIKYARKAAKERGESITVS